MISQMVDDDVNDDIITFNGGLVGSFLSSA